jgi:hypothetical protein
MSIQGAVAELDAEIKRLTEEIVRIKGVRTSLLEGGNGSSGVGNPVKRTYRARVKKSSPAKKPAVSKKPALARKTTAAKGVAPAKKRVMSPEGKRRISEANKKRWAKIKDTKPTS